MERLRRRAAAHHAATGRPLVTLSFAQSLDGSIAEVRGRPMALSCPASRVYTHRLRATHHAILVGIGTVLADDPQLNVRLAEGAHPRPVVLDTRLRFPLNARMLRCAGPPPLILTSRTADAAREDELTRSGAEVVRLPVDGRGNVSVERTLQELGRRGMESVMVEGGGEVITSFLRCRRVDQMIVTIALMLVGGVPAVGTLRPDERTPAIAPEGDVAFPRLRNVTYERIGEDLVLSGEPDWKREAGTSTRTNGDP